MESLTELYKVGRGPSSSHTIGPFRAVQWYIKMFPVIDSMKVILLSLVVSLLIATAKGVKKVDIDFNIKEYNIPHPNAMDVIGYDKAKNQLKKVRFISVGGGTIKILDYPPYADDKVYPQKNFNEVRHWCYNNKKDLVGYVKHFDIAGYKNLKYIWQTMSNAIDEAVNHFVPFDPKVTEFKRKSKLMFANLKKKNLIPAKDVDRNYCMAVACSISEINTMHSVVVTAPTSGSCGIMPAVMWYAKEKLKFSEQEIIDALAVGGVIGNIFKTNGSIAGASGGCQAECGAACSMAAAAFCYLLKGNIKQIEAAAITVMEHHLGLTCDAIKGEVYGPCIERNGQMALRTIDAAEYALLCSNEKNDPDYYFYLDDVIEVEKRTGEDLNPIYRETGIGGLSHQYKLIETKKESKNINELIKAQKWNELRFHLEKFDNLTKDLADQVKKEKKKKIKNNCFLCVE